MQSKCSKSIAFVFRPLGSYQPSLNGKKDSDRNENLYQSTYLSEILE